MQQQEFVACCFLGKMTANPNLYLAGRLVLKIPLDPCLEKLLVLRTLVWNT